MRHALRPALLLAIPLLVVGSNACTFKIPINAKYPRYEAQERLPARVGIRYEPGYLAYSYTASGMFWIGMAHKWQFQTGREGMNTAKPLLELFFEEVDIVSDGKGLPPAGLNRKAPKDAPDPPDPQHAAAGGAPEVPHDLYVKPAVPIFNISSFSMSSTAVLRYLFTDPRGRELGEFVGNGRAGFSFPQFGAILMGVFMGKVALRESARRAFAKAYAAVVAAMKKSRDSGQLHSWLSPPAPETPQEP